MNVGFLVVNMVAKCGPTTHLEDSNFWMVIFALQIPCQIVVLLLHTFVYTEDTLEFCVKKGDKVQAMALIKKVYSSEDAEFQDTIYEEKYEFYQKQNAEGGQKKDSAWEALTSPEMRGSSWACIAISISNNLSGIGIVCLYSTTIFGNMTKNGALATFNIQQENNFVGMACTAGAFVSFTVISSFSRRAIFIGGHFSCAALNFIIAYFAMHKQHDMVLYGICLEFFLFNASLGSVFWIYLSEIAQSDSVMGLCQFLCMTMLTFESSISLKIINGSIGVSGLFMILGAIQFACFTLLSTIVKETRGLKAHEKKEIYKNAP